MAAEVLDPLSTGARTAAHDHHHHHHHPGAFNNAGLCFKRK